MARYNTDLQQNNTELDEILQTVNNLPEAGSSPPVIQPIKITKNSTTTAPEGVDGYSPIEVAVPSDRKPEETKNVKYTSNGKQIIIPTAGKVLTSVGVEIAVPSDKKPEQTYVKTYTSNGNYPITPDTGKVIKGGSINVNCPVPKAEQEKSTTAKDNGTVSVIPDPGKVLSKATVVVNVPKQKPEETKEVTYTSNGSRDVTPTVGSVFSKVRVNVNVPPPEINISPLEVTTNGVYNVPVGVHGYNPVTVKTPVPKQEQEKSATVADNGVVTITPDTGKVLSKATVNVNVPKRKPEEEKTVSYTSNGAKTVTPANGKVLTKVTINVDVPDIPPKVTALNVTSNGVYNVPSGIDGYNPVTVNTPVPKLEQSKTINITSNGETKVTPDQGKVLSEVVARVNIPFITVHTGLDAPQNSLGRNGDIYLQD